MNARARFSVEDAASHVRVINDNPPADVVVNAFGEHFPQGARALEHALGRLMLLEGFTFTTGSGQRLYVRRVA